MRLIDACKYWRKKAEKKEKIVLNIDQPKNTLDCPFLEEDCDNELYCYFNSNINTRCVGLYNKGCYIIKTKKK